MAWSRVEGTASRYDPATSTTGARQDIDSWKALRLAHMKASATAPAWSGLRFTMKADTRLSRRSAGKLRNGAKAHGYGWASRRARPGT